MRFPWHWCSSITTRTANVPIRPEQCCCQHPSLKNAFFLLCPVKYLTGLHCTQILTTQFSFSYEINQPSDMKHGSCQWTRSFFLPNVNINGDRGEWVALIVFLCCPLGKKPLSYGVIQHNTLLSPSYNLSPGN